MRIGYRIIEPDEVGRWRGELAQVSVYKHWNGSAGLARQCAESCRERGLSYVLHPVGYSLLNPDDVQVIRDMLPWAGESLILHDERSPGGGRLADALLQRYREALLALRAETQVSLENSEHTADAVWFWRTMEGSVTLDMGHMESAGLDSAEFVASLPRDIIERVDYAHMHHNNGLHGGITDHWPLRPGCRELRALEALLEMKGAVGVILEINERDETGESLALLEELRERITR